MSGFDAIGETELVSVRDGFLRLTAATFTDPDGGHIERFVVRTPGAVAVVPVVDTDAGPEVVLVRQFRAPIGAAILEIPAGLRDVEGEPPDETARRELVEEAGFSAGRLTLLTTFLNAAGMTDQETWVYLAEDMTEVGRQAQGPEETHMTIETWTLERARRAVGREIVDAKTVIGVLLAGEALGR